MKKVLILLLGFVLTACGVGAPAQPTAGPTATPVVVTVVVTVIPTEVPTTVPTNTPLPPPTQEIATAPAVPTNSPAPGGTATLISTGGGGAVFTNLTRTSNIFSLRCLPSDITFSLTSVDPYITEVDLYYRIEDQQSASITEWKNAGKMDTDGNGNFTIRFEALDVHPDLRVQKGWFDYQFIGLSKSGGVVGRSEKIEKQVTYTIECP